VAVHLAVHVRPCRLIRYHDHLYMESLEEFFEFCRALSVDTDNHRQDRPPLPVADGQDLLQQSEGQLVVEAYPLFCGGSGLWFWRGHIAPGCPQHLSHQSNEIGRRKTWYHLDQDP
jgi:hypothetical protein